MRVMDVSTKDNDCNVELELPVKEKKLKQARLPFQRLSTGESPKIANSNKTSPTSNKKRKINSPVPGEDKTSKIVKLTTKENDLKFENSKDIELIEIDDEKDKESNNKIESNQDEESSKNNESRGSISGEEKKTKSMATTKSDKNKVKSNVLNRFLIRTDKERKNTILPSNQSYNNQDESNSNLIHTVNQFINDKDCSAKSNDNTIESDDNDEENDLSNSKEKNESVDLEEINELKLMLNSSTQKTDNDMCLTSSSSDEEEREEQENSISDNITSQATPSKTTSKSPLSLKLRKLTPKQLEKRLEKEKRKEEREKMKLEKEKKREEERENRRKEKQDRERRKKEKEEKERAEKEQKRKEREQKQKEKEASEKKKEEEKRKREEAKEEEKRRKEEEKLEAERKKQKAASNFIGFFVPKKPSEVKTTDEEQTTTFSNFMPFEVKADMKLAPVNRRKLNDEEKMQFDKLWKSSDLDESQLYLNEIKFVHFEPRKSGKTFAPEAKDDIVIIDEEDDDDNVIEKGNIPIEKHRPKLLFFHENQRPPYWGTWRKKSEMITSRKPLSKDTKWFDYEVDSDEEWEEEEPGESLHGSDDEKDEENPEENEYDVDNEFMVPHGYLSDEEMRADEDDEEDMSPETQKFKLKVLGEQFEAERNAKTLKIKPKVVGCIWQNADGQFPENTSTHTVKLLTVRQAWVHEIPIVINATLDTDNQNSSESGTPLNKSVESKVGSKKKVVPDEAMPDLIRMLHLNVHSRVFLIKEFMTYWLNRKNGEQPISKSCLSQKIREIARWTIFPEEGPMHLKYCWYVSDDVRKEYLGDEKLEIPNQWKYTLTPKKRSEKIEDNNEKLEKEKEEKEKEKKNMPLITQFAKKITQEEMKKQLTEIRLTPPVPRPPKRATLISVGRDEQLPKSPRVSLIDRFVSTGQTITLPASAQEEECMIISNIGDDNKKPETKKRIVKEESSSSTVNTKKKEKDEIDEDD